jgi:hypothetical protein
VFEADVVILANGRWQDREFLTWEKAEKKKRKQWESWNELVQGELTLRLFDASNVAKWQDVRNTFMSRFERDRIDNMLSAKYAALRPRPMHPAPQYSLELTDYEMLELADTLEVPWNGTRSYEEAQQKRMDERNEAKVYTRAEAKRLDQLFLTRSQRRTLEQRVSRTWKRDLPHVQMPLWCVQFSDTAIVPTPGKTQSQSQNDMRPIFEMKCFFPNCPWLPGSICHAIIGRGRWC